MSIIYTSRFETRYNAIPFHIFYLFTISRLLSIYVPSSLFASNVFTFCLFNTDLWINQFWLQGCFPFYRARTQQPHQKLRLRRQSPRLGFSRQRTLARQAASNDHGPRPHLGPKRRREAGCRGIRGLENPYVDIMGKHICVPASGGN